MSCSLFARAMGMALLFSPVSALDLELLADVNPTPAVPEGIAPDEFGELGGAIYFAGDVDGLGRELCVWTGSAATSGLFFDVFAGPSSAEPRDFTAVGGQLFFTARAKGTGRELWVTDGTVPGTHLVADLAAGALASEPLELTEAAGLLFFTAYTTDFGRELWRSDGTPGGTMQLADLEPGFSNSSPSELTSFSGELVFTTNFSSTDFGDELWRSDGTPAGTVLLADLLPGSQGSDPSDLVVAGDWLYCAAYVDFDREIWRTDGVVHELAANVSPTDSSYPHGLTAFGDEVYFAAQGAPFDVELWKTDGTQVGTVSLGDLDPAGSSLPQDITATSAGVFFTATTPGTGRELWFTDGTPGAATMIELTGGFESTAPTQLTALGAELVFVANTGGLGNEPWSSDGSLVGTQLLADIAPAGGSDPTSLFAAGGLVYFGADGGTIGRELYVSDGSPGGTLLAANLNADPQSRGSNATVLGFSGGRMLFAADDGTHGVEPWITDGTPAGTQVLADLVPGINSSSPSEAVVFNDRFYFPAIVPPLAVRLVQSDGTPLGTSVVPTGAAVSASELASTSLGVFLSLNAPGQGAEPWIVDASGTATLLADLTGDGDSSEPADFTQVPGGPVVFTARGPGVPFRSLWATDGSAVVQLPAPGGSITTLVAAGEHVFFTASEAKTGSELWVTDGTVPGTFVIDIEPGAVGSSPSDLTAVGERLFFDIEPGGIHSLWISDGTPAGTELVAELDPAATWGIAETDAFGERLLFTLPNFSTKSLWVSDGTEVGTVALLQLPAQLGQGGVTEVGVAGDRAWFSVDDDTGTDELWVTDGTPVGTTLYADLDPLDLVSQNQLGSFDALGGGSEVVFIGNDPNTGEELWVASATEPNPTLLADLAPGAAASFPAFLGRVGGYYLFRGDDYDLGSELYRQPVAATGAWVLENFGTGCPGSGDLVPSISGVGPAQLGANLELAVDDGLASSAAGLFWSFERLALPVGGGCRVYFGLPFEVAGAVLLDGAGSGSLTLPVPNLAGIVGVPVHFQYAVIDPGTPLGGTLTDGLEVLIAP